MDNEKKDTLEQPIGENADFLTVNQYAEKYGYTVNQVKNFRTRGLFFEKKIPVEGKGRRAGQRNKDIVRVLLLDLPVDQQPTKRNIKLGNIREKDAAPFGYRKNSSADAERKKRLKEKYLPVFIEKAPPDKMVFGAEELLEMFGLQDNTFFRDWKGWGLEGREIPDSYRHLNTERPLTGKYMYLRRDVYRFLNGDWGHSKEGTADDILIGAVEDRTVLEGEYYKFNPNKVYPADGNGVLAWIDDTNIVREDKRQNKWTKFVPWEEQRIFIKNAFKLNAKGDYKHNLIVFSAPRGDGKTYIIALLTLFRFFNRFGEIINLSGNSKEQATFAHYELCKKIIQNTPILKNTPGLVIKEKYISLMAGPKEAVCQIKAIPSSVGLLPGTTCAVFTELHNLEERQFFVDLWTSTRATPNAMVLVDTTVAAPGHIVYELWESQKRGDDPLLYFHHYADKHCNPETTPEQLNSFRRHMLEHEYNMYFRNRWEDATGGLFTADRIREMGYCGVNGVVGRTVDLEIAVQTLMDLDQKRSKYANARIQLATVNKEIRGIEETLITTDSIYHTPATSADLDRIQKVFGVNFIIGVGLDRAQMISKAPDRTVLTCVARGIVSPEVSYYFVLDMFIPKESTLTVLSEKILDWTTTYGWIDKVVIESYLGQDFYSWCLERGYDAECTPATFKNQKIVFTELYQLMEQGLLKAPKIPYYADDSGELFFGYSVKEDILREEMKAFSYSSTKKWFGAPEKRLKGGIKDDTIYSLAWAVYATQGEGIPFGMRGSMNTIGEAMVNKDVVGNYGN